MGTQERPRLNVYRSLNHIYVQLIDDLKGVTLAAASTADDRKGARVTGGNVASAKMVGKKIAELAKQKGYTKVVFDRGVVVSFFILSIVFGLNRYGLNRRTWALSPWR